MARLFNDAANDKLVNTTASWSLPLSLSAFFRFDVEPGDMMIVSIGEAADTGYLCLRTEAAGDRLRAQVFDGVGASFSQHTTDLAANTWYHGLAVFTSNTSRRVYLDGDIGATSTDSRFLDSHDQTTIGVSADSTPVGYMSGEVAEVAIWDTTALTVADALMLAKGYSPLFVKPQNLKAYWPLIRGLNDRVGGYNMTATGTVVSAHPRAIYPSKIWTPSGVAAAPPTGGQVITIIMSKLIVPSLYLKQGKTKRRDFMKNTFLASLGIK